MSQPDQMSVYPLDVYFVTEKGRQELERGSTELTTSELKLMVLLDGKANVVEIMERAVKMGEHEVAMLMPKLIADGLIAPAGIAAQEGLDFSYFFDEDKTAPTSEAEAQAQKEAEAVLPALQREGFYVSITRRAAGVPRVQNAAACTILTIEDDPGISLLIRQILKQEGYETRAASNRSEVVVALRKLPSPDLVLLDVMLPDANGFDILASIKQHPVLKPIPVIMLTGEATRDNVLRGLALGASGYITKPFDLNILRKGIRNVLGLD
jgi:two-component system, OmpR family, response regulator